MTEAEIEAVARAMSDEWHGRLSSWYEAAGYPHSRPPWESEDRIWLPVARAAIEALDRVREEAIPAAPDDPSHPAWRVLYEWHDQKKTDPAVATLFLKAGTPLSRLAALISEAIAGAENRAMLAARPRP